MFVAIATICIFAVSGCASQKETFFNENGKEKAYNKLDSGKILHIEKNVSYYLDSSVQGNYLDAAKYSIRQANNATSKYKFSTTSSNNSQYVIRVANLGDNGSNAVNQLTYNSATGQIVSSTIYLNSYYMNNFSLNGLKHVCTHELGHTFGLTDLGDSKFEDKSIMFDSYGNGSKYTFVTYQEFDKENINWYYN